MLSAVCPREQEDSACPESSQVTASRPQTQWLLVTDTEGLMPQLYASPGASLPPDSTREKLVASPAGTAVVRPGLCREG